MNNQHLQAKNLSLFDARRGERGFSIMELLLGLTLFLVVTSAIYGLLQVSRIDRDRSSNRGDMLKNARLALNLIGRDVVNAGLGYSNNSPSVPDDFLKNKLGLRDDNDTARDKLTGIVAGDNVYTNNLNSDANVKTDLVAFAMVDRNFYNAVEKKEFKAQKTLEGTGAKLNFMTGKTAVGLNKYDLYLIETYDNRPIVAMMNYEPSATATELVIAPGDPLGINQSWLGTESVNSTMLQNCIPADSEDENAPPIIGENCSVFPATLKRFQLIKYHVKPDGTLVRTTYGNKPNKDATAQIEELPLAYGIEDLQIKYVLDSGIVVDDPAKDAAGDYKPAEFAGRANQIRQVTLTLTIRSTEMDKQTNQPMKIKLTSTFSALNLEY